MESIQELNEEKTLAISKSINGNFNMFRLKPIPKNTKRSLPYRRRDFYKVMFVRGNIDFHYADRTVTIEKQALVFSNPLIPYTVERLENIVNGSYCIMSKGVYNTLPRMQKLSVFKPDGDHVFELSDQTARDVELIFEKMHEEIASEYIYKEDLIINRIFELMHMVMRLQPSDFFEVNQMNASKRITMLFFELLERQFPIDADHPIISVKSASDFAQQLNVHVNHLNRIIKENTGKTTTQLIKERILQEAKVLIHQSNWSVKEISNALGFKESTHFNNFFKKNMSISPTVYRNSKL